MFDNIDYKSSEKQSTSYRLITVEKGYGGRLSTLGKIVCFSWLLDNVLITEEDIKLVVPLDNPMKMVSYIEGYDRAKKMFDLGFDKKDYDNFLENGINKNQKEAVKLVIDTAYGRASKKVK